MRAVVRGGSRGAARTRPGGGGYTTGMSSPYLSGPAYSPAPPEVRTEPRAVIALVLALAAWTPVVPFVGAVAALVLAGSARRRILGSSGGLTGLGLVTAARALSWLHLVFVLLLFLLFLATLLGLFTFSLFGVAVG